MKICSKCKVEKDESEFYKNKSTKSGLHHYCKKCHNKNIQSEKRKEYLKSEKHKKYLRDYMKTEVFKNIHDKYSQSEKGKNTKSYVKSCLGLKKIPSQQVPNKLIELKRLQLKIKKELKNGVQNENKN